MPATTKYDLKASVQGTDANDKSEMATAFTIRIGLPAEVDGDIAADATTAGTEMSWRKNRPFAAKEDNTVFDLSAYFKHDTDDADGSYTDSCVEYSADKTLPTGLYISTHFVTGVPTTVETVSSIKFQCKD